MKRIISIALVALMILMLGACGSAQSATVSSASPAPEQVSTSPAPSSVPVAPSSSVPSSSAPVAPSSSAPVAPSSSASVAPSSSAPVAPSSSAPVAPSSSAPVAPSSSASVAPSSSASVAPSSSVPPSSQAEAKPAEGIGAVGMFPNDLQSGDLTPLGVDRLIVLVPREGVEPGDVELTVYDAKDDSEFCSLNLEDGGVIEYLDWKQTNGDLNLFSESEGTAMGIYLGKALEADHNYYVLAEEGWLTIPEQNITSKPISNKTTWVIRVGDNGILSDDEESEVTVGQVVTFTIMLGEKGAEAKLSVTPKDAAILSEKEISEDGEVTITYQKKGGVTTQVDFYDQKGALINSIEHYVVCK